MTAEQLAPFLEPPADPKQWEELASAPGGLWREDWVLPALLQFGGEVEVSDEGNLTLTPTPTPTPTPTLTLI